MVKNAMPNGTVYQWDYPQEGAPGDKYLENMSHSTIPSGFVKSVLQNGVGRYICQLQRITLVFCKSSAGSRGLR